jgi:tRNA (guanine-N7-)-methyltransferase
MPIKSHDIFADVVSTFRNDCNAYVSKLIEAQNSGSLPVAIGPALRDFPGQWRQKFTAIDGDHSKKPLIVEIGCHTGHTICDMAESHPEVLFVGVDITFKRVVETAERAKSRGLKNIYVVLANAHGIDGLFQESEVTGFITFFPDPWKKKKHAHNRLYSEDFCSTIFAKLKSSGFLWLKTDQEPYFNNACEIAAKSGFQESSNIPVFDTQDFSSFFMRRFELQGLPWYGRKWLKLN